MHWRHGIIISFLFLIIFLAIACTVQFGAGFGGLDTHSSAFLQNIRAESGVARNAFLFVTDLGSGRVLTSLALAMAAVLLILRKPALSCTWLLILILGFVGYGVLKDFYARPRPEIHDPAVIEKNFSFPSGHSFESLVAYGFLAYLVVPFIPRRRIRIVFVSGMALLVLAIGFSRILLGAHYLSDVLGGYAAGGCWLVACVTATETVRWRRFRPAKQII